MRRWEKDYSTPEAACYSTTDRHGLWTIERQSSKGEYGANPEWLLFFSAHSTSWNTKDWIETYPTLREAKAGAQRYLENKRG